MMLARNTPRALVWVRRAHNRAPRPNTHAPNRIEPTAYTQPALRKVNNLDWFEAEGDILPFR